MPKGVEKDALGSYGTATGQANNAYGIAAPIYGQMATNPQGYTPQQMANLTTASNQTLGGANSAAAGEGALASARTNNAGGYQAAIDDAARQSGAQQSQNNLGIQNQNVALENQHQEEGLQGLSGIYGEGNSAGDAYLGQANTAAANNPWVKFGTAALGAAGQAASGYLGGLSKGCWIAEAVYGVDDPRTHVVRTYLNGPFRNSRTGDFIMRMYLRFGERMARFVRASRVLRIVFRPFFDAALSSALGAK